jgi:hypothetical protein
VRCSYLSISQRLPRFFQEVGALRGEVHAKDFAKR